MIYTSIGGGSMHKKVSRVEAIIIMRNAKEFRAKQAMAQPVVEAVPEVIVVSEAPVVVPKKKSFFTYVIDFFKKKGT